MAGFNTAITGLKAASTNLDVTGNNIANSSTIGFKSSRTEFGDIYATAVVGAGSSNVAGAGVTVTDIAQDFQAGTTQFTNNNLDLAINGSGFFQLDDGQGSVTYTRAGAFELDKNGFVVSKSGKFLQGYGLDSQGNRLPIGNLAVDQKESPPKATDAIGLKFNINDTEDATTLTVPYDKDVPSSFTYSTTVRTFDSLGNEHTIKYNMVEQRPVKNTVAVQLDMLSGDHTIDLSGSSYDLSGLDATMRSAIGVADKRIDSSTLAYDNVTKTLTFEVKSKYTDYGDFVIAEDVADAAFPLAVTIGERPANEVRSFDIASGAAVPGFSIGGVAMDITATMTEKQIADLIFSKEAEIKDRNPAVESVSIVESGGLYRLDVRFKAEYGDIPAGDFLIFPEVDPIDVNDVLGVNTAETYNGDNTYMGQYQMYAYLNGEELLDIGKSVDPGEVGYDTITPLNSQSEVGAALFGYDPSSGFLTSVNDKSFVAGATATALTIKGADPADTSTTINLDISGSTQFGSASIVKGSSQNGYTKGDLIGVSFAESGEMVASFSNNQKQNLGVVAFATFENQSGLQPAGDTEWGATLSSGNAVLNPPGTGLNGSLRSAALESSNVDLSTELVRLIEAQRNFQANSKTLETLNTVTQSILQI